MTWRTLRQISKADQDLRNVFVLAEKLNKTVPELLTGQAGEMTGHEFLYWMAHFKLSHQETEEANKKKQKSTKPGPNDTPVPKTMGGNT